MRTKKFTEQQIKRLEGAGFTIGTDGNVATIEEQMTVELIQPVDRSAPIATVILPDNSLLDNLVEELDEASAA